jgi:hypothetical protein
MISCTQTRAAGALTAAEALLDAPAWAGSSDEHDVVTTAVAAASVTAILRDRLRIFLPPGSAAARAASMRRPPQ